MTYDLDMLSLATRFVVGFHGQTVYIERYDNHGRLLPSCAVRRVMTHVELVEQFIVEHPGCTFTELEEGSGVAGVPGSAGSRAAAGRARDALVREGRIETKRDGRCVRHYPAGHGTP